MSASIRFACPTCRRPHSIAGALAGKKITCKCGKVLRVPSMSPPALPTFSAVKEVVGESIAKRASPGRDRCPLCGASPRAVQVYRMLKPLGPVLLRIRPEHLPKIKAALSQIVRNELE